ncbi:Phage tail protein [Halomonas sp. THAF12]|uniref:phage tail protein I n=1 Tax=Halomonas sp. THAF12 TaxID=2587849 RepID=UPI0012683496|nr:phage tail protein I [Halomonas sp. THAF12]QFT84489.1 Phage tail protein [Halomonas sp. THAF12]
MSNSRSLLPPNSSPLERAVESATDRLSAPAVHTLWDPWDCPAHLLPWLAWAVGVGEWADDWPEDVRRQSIASAMAIARRRGSVWAVREALRAAGYADATVEEGLPVLRHDGAQLRDGTETYGGGNRWAMFRLIADIGEDKGVGGAELGRLLRLVDAAKPVRSELREVAYRTTVADDFDLAEAQHTTVKPTVSEVRPAGRRRDGSLLRNNAIRLDPEPLRRDARWFRGGEIQRTGVSPYAEWQITGETRDNVWDVETLNVTTALSEAHAASDPGRAGLARRDGALRYGAAPPAMLDGADLTIVVRRRRNGRIHRNASAQRLGSAPVHTTL